MTSVKICGERARNFQDIFFLDIVDLEPNASNRIGVEKYPKEPNHYPCPHNIVTAISGYKGTTTVFKSITFNPFPLKADQGSFSGGSGQDRGQGQCPNPFKRATQRSEGFENLSAG